MDISKYACMKGNNKCDNYVASNIWVLRVELHEGPLNSLFILCATDYVNIQDEIPWCVPFVGNMVLISQTKKSK